MADLHSARLRRELFLAALGTPLETLEPWVMDRMTALLEEDHVHSGQVIWPKGAVVDALYFMHHGSVEMRREGANPLRFEGRWLLGSFEGHSHSRTERELVALADFDVLKVARRGWLRLLEDSFALTRLSVQAAANATAVLDERLPSRRAHAPDELIRPSPPLRRLSVVERLAILTQVEIVRGVGVQALADLAGASREIILTPGEPLFSRNDPHENLFFVVQGEVVATRRHPDVTRRYTELVLVGGGAALTNRIRQWEANASGPVRAIAVPIEAWFDRMELHFDLVQSTLGILGREREAILEQLAELSGPTGVVLT
jgi:hypothetical protein